MKILVTAPYNKNALENLQEQLGEIIYRPWKPHGRAYNEKELTQLFNETGAEALITEHDEVTRNVINANADLQFIGVCRGTPSNVDIRAATENNIPVFNTPARNATAVAEMFIANVITFMRNTLAGHEWLKKSEWESGAHASYLQFKGNELSGKTIGMVGFGAIGQLIAQMVKNFPCDIQFYDPYLKSTEQIFRKTTIENVFKTSDIVSVHLPVTLETEQMIDAALLGLMKPNAIFVNTARAVVVNRKDLYDVLHNKLIRGAILDVFHHEPPDELDYRIINLPNVLATPHIAGATYEVEDHHSVIMNDNLFNWFLNGKKDLKQLVNKEVLTLQN